MIQPLGFVDTSTFTAMYVLKHRERVVNGVLMLRDVKEGDADPSDLPILKEWKSARGLLTRLKTQAAAFFNGVTPDLGRAWIEVVPGGFGTPWSSDAGDYAEGHVRTRTCLIPSAAAISFSGGQSAALAVGVVNRVDHQALCSEVNHGDTARVHLIVDFKIPVDDVQVD